MQKTGFLLGGAALLMLFLSITISLSVGSANIPVVDVWKVIIHKIPYIGSWIKPVDSVATEQIIWNVRFPRIVLGLLVGACLSLAGSGFQGILRNPLAEPFTLGVASGSSVGAALLILLGLQYVWFGKWTIPLFAFCAGMVTLLIVIWLAKTEGRIRTETLILAGIVMQAFLGATVSFMISLSEKTVNEIVFWLMGSLSLSSWEYTFVLFVYVCIGFIFLLAFSRVLNLFELGERHAAHLGVNVERTKWFVLIVCTLLSAAAVSVAGVIGFVGLVVPHLVRLMIGPDYRYIIPLSAILGSVYLVSADTLARTMLIPKEIPLGVVTAFIGAPFFAYLLFKRKKSLLNV